MNTTINILTPSLTVNLKRLKEGQVIGLSGEHRVYEKKIFPPLLGKKKCCIWIQKVRVKVWVMERKADWYFILCGHLRRQKTYWSAPPLHAQRKRELGRECGGEVQTGSKTVTHPEFSGTKGYEKCNPPPHAPAGPRTCHGRQIWLGQVLRPKKKKTYISVIWCECHQLGWTRRCKQILQVTANACGNGVGWRSLSAVNWSCCSLLTMSFNSRAEQPREKDCHLNTGTACGTLPPRSLLPVSAPKGERAQERDLSVWSLTHPQFSAPD